MSESSSQRIDKVIVHMYRMGTGDCFVLKFMKGDDVSFKMLIDCGCWSGSRTRLKPYLEQVMQDVESHVNALVVTHEHKDHVLGFERGKAMFTSARFKVDRIWMGWPEKDGDKEVERWKEEYGQKKMALAAAAQAMKGAVDSVGFKSQFQGTHQETLLVERRQGFAQVLEAFAELHVSGDEYKGSLAGMAVVKEGIAKDNIEYYGPGDLIENIPGLEGVRIFVLGPPSLYEEVKVAKERPGEAYDHNLQLEDTDLFVSALTSTNEATRPGASPFESSYVSHDPAHASAYERTEEAWRRIDSDWLFGAGSFALRMNSLTNNLSLVLAIEFVETGRVLLFPGDAEIGSWRSWHDIDWTEKVKGLKTKDLLRRVVFYKVAHHLSHNGTAREIGLDLMTDPDLVAMATLDYDVIPNGWKTTMPNRVMLKDLLEKTKGRMMIMKTDGMFYDVDELVPLEEEIDRCRRQMSEHDRSKFESALDTSSKRYVGFTVEV